MNIATIGETLLAEDEFDLVAVVVEVVGVASEAFPDLTVTASFIPPEQCPGTEHMK